MRTKSGLRLAGLSVAAVILAGCSGQQQVATTHVTLMTTSYALDTATSMAVAEYLETHDVEVDIQHHGQVDDVFAALAHSPGAADHTSLGIITAPEQSDTQEATLALPDGIERIAQAPAELGFVASASSITAANFAREVVAATNPETPLAAACAEQTWYHPQLATEDIQHMKDALAEDGCEPSFEAVQALDTETYGAMIQQLVVEPETVVMLRGLDPAIPDQRLETLDVKTQQWPTSHVVAIASSPVDDVLMDHVGEVLDVIDSDAATSLLRGYHDAQTSTSDLQYDVEDAIRFWLADVDLLSADTVINITHDNE